MTEKIRFLHIPKTAGSTFDECLFLQYLRPYLLRRLFVFKGKLAEDAQRIDAMSPAVRGRIAICTGHAPLVTDIEVVDAMPTVTLLRDPVERVRSFCQHVSEGKSPKLYDPAANGVFDLDLFLAVHRVQLNNFQTRMLLGRGSYKLPHGDSDAIVAQGMNILESTLACFGITEDLDRSLLLFREVLGWQHWPVYRSRNVSNPQARIQFEARHVARIKELNRIDIALYELARELYDRRQEQYSAKFDRELPLFRAALKNTAPRFALLDFSRRLALVARMLRRAWSCVAPLRDGATR